jgi:AbiV family abortive infection protein
MPRPGEDGGRSAHGDVANQPAEVFRKSPTRLCTGTPVMDEKEREDLAELVRGAQLAFDNAEALYNEAQLLGTRGAFARALTLHQISLEELSKLDILCVAATSVVMGHPVDLAKLAGRFRQHKVKNYNNAYMSVRTDAEVEASKKGDGAAAIEIFKAQQAGIHRILNTNKNASLYVDYEGGGSSHRQRRSVRRWQRNSNK